MNRPAWTLLLPLGVVVGMGVALWLGRDRQGPGEQWLLGLVLLAGLCWTVLEALLAGGRRLGQAPAELPAVEVPLGLPPQQAPVNAEWIELRQALLELPRSTGVAVREALPEQKLELGPVVEAILGLAAELHEGRAAAARERAAVSSLLEAHGEKLAAVERAVVVGHEAVRAQVAGLVTAERLGALERVMAETLGGLQGGLGAGLQRLEEAVAGVEQTTAERMTAVEQVTVEGLSGLHKMAEQGLQRLGGLQETAGQGVQRLEQVTAGLSGLHKTAEQGVQRLEQVTAGLGGLHKTADQGLEQVVALGAALEKSAVAVAATTAQVTGLRQQIGELALQARESLAPLLAQVAQWLQRPEAQPQGPDGSQGLREEAARAVEVFAGVARNLESTSAQVRELFFGAKAAADEMKRVRAGLDAAVGKLGEQDKSTQQIAAQLQALSRELEEMTDNLGDMNQSLAEQVKNSGRMISMGRLDQANLVGALDRVHRSLEKMSGARR